MQRMIRFPPSFLNVNTLTFTAHKTLHFWEGKKGENVLSVNLHLPFGSVPAAQHPRSHADSAKGPIRLRN